MEGLIDKVWRGQPLTDEEFASLKKESRKWQRAERRAHDLAFYAKNIEKIKAWHVKHQAWLNGLSAERRLRIADEEAAIMDIVNSPDKDARKAFKARARRLMDAGNTLGKYNHHRAIAKARALDPNYVEPLFVSVELSLGL